MDSIKIMSKDSDNTLVVVTIGDILRDDLTGEAVELIEIIDKNTIKVDSTHQDGYRYIWEVSELF